MVSRGNLFADDRDLADEACEGGRGDILHFVGRKFACVVIVQMTCKDRGNAAFLGFDEGQEFLGCIVRAVERAADGHVTAPPGRLAVRREHLGADGQMQHHQNRLALRDDRLQLFDLLGREAVGRITDTDDHEFTGDEIDKFVKKTLKKLEFTLGAELR